MIWPTGWSGTLLVWSLMAPPVLAFRQLDSYSTGRDVSDGFEKPAGVPPVHPAEGGQLHVLDGPPGSSSGDQLGLVKADDRFGHGVVIGVSFRPDRGDGTFLSESLGVSDEEVLHSSVGVVDQTFETLCLAGPNRLFQGVESQIGSEGVGDPPADDPSREDVDDERRVGEAGPGGHIGDVGDPQLVGRRRHEVTVDQVSRPAQDVTRDSGTAFPAPADGLPARGRP